MREKESMASGVYGVVGWEDLGYCYLLGSADVLSPNSYACRSCSTI
jgi:hypothetical protein